MAKFTIVNLKSHEEQEYFMPQDTIVFGRTNTCDIELPSKAVSRKHAEIVRENQDYFLSDLESGNGTFLNSQKIRPLEKNLLRSGDMIRIEDYEIRFQLTEDHLDRPVEEDTDTDILEIKLIKKMLKALDTDDTPSVEVLNSSAAGKRLAIGEGPEELVIGRDPLAQLSIDEAVLSRQHAKLLKKWGGVVIQDCKSKNGTFVNNDRIEEKLLRDGDKIMLGTVKLLYRNPKDVNLEIISQEISRKKKEAAMREAELLAAKQLEQEERDAAAAEEVRVRKEAEAQEVNAALEAEKADAEAESQAAMTEAEQAHAAPEMPPPSPQTAAAAAAGKKPGFSFMEKIFIALGIIVGLAAIGALASLFM